MKIDTTYLTVHPATLRWWEMRGTCSRCLWRIEVGVTATRTGRLGERCGAITVGDIKQVWLQTYGRQATGPTDEAAYCIDARLEGAPCGPQALLFKEKP